MDKQEYLNQISAAARPAKSKSKSGWLHSPIFLVLIGGVVAFILIAIVGAVMNGGRTTGKERLFDLILHVDDTSEIIADYQPSVKSSTLRSYSASLASTLSNTSQVLTSYASETYGFKSNKVDAKIADARTAAKEELDGELFEAKINGLLDRIYAHKMTYEVSLLIVSEQQVLKSPKDDTVAEALTASYDSLTNLYAKFNDFSETNQ